MNLERLFHVLVVTGASSALGVAGCSSDGSAGGSDSGTGGSASSTGGGATASESDGASCDVVCHPSATLQTWTDCNGCCCWVPAGTNLPPAAGSPACGEEPCCVGRGR